MVNRAGLRSDVITEVTASVMQCGLVSVWVERFGFWLMVLHDSPIAAHDLRLFLNVDQLLPNDFSVTLESPSSTVT